MTDQAGPSNPFPSVGDPGTGTGAAAPIPGVGNAPTSFQNFDPPKPGETFASPGAPAPAPGEPYALPGGSEAYPSVGDVTVPSRPPSGDSGGGAASAENQQDGSGGSDKAAAKGPPNDTVTLVINGQRLQGWQDIRVSMGVDRCPSDFAFLVTEKYPMEAAKAVVVPGDKCEVWLGSDKVITGFVDRLSPAISAGQHAVRITGRSKTQDIVDCAVIIKGNQLSAVSVVSLARLLCKQYDTQVVALSGDGLPVPQINIMLGETVYDVVERLARYSGFLVYDDAEGRLVLAQVGAQRMASGIAEGPKGNIEFGASMFSMDERYSQYLAYPFSMDIYSQTGPFPPVAHAEDPGVPRRRVKIIISEQMNQGVPIAELRVKWEKNRRYGRSQQITATVDSWRDRNGKLWTPNAHIPIALPSWKLPSQDWIIAEVAFLKGQGGTHAQLTCMPPEGLSPQPELIQRFDWQVGDALRGIQPGQGAQVPPATTSTPPDAIDATKPILDPTAGAGP